MKKLTVLLLSTIFLASCGENDNQKLAHEVCDCFTKAQIMDHDDVKRPAAFQACNEKQTEVFATMKGDQKKIDEFWKILNACSKKLSNMQDK